MLSNRSQASFSKLSMLKVYVLMPICAFFTGELVSQDVARERLNESPRHHEWVGVKRDSRVIQSFLVFPEVKEKVPAILIIHENRGLTDWVRSVADQIAEAGYIAIAPDLLSGMGPDGGKTSDFPDRNAARDALYKLSPEQIVQDLHAVSDYVSKLDACNGKLVVAGFCWGGRQTFGFAARRSDLSGAFVFYGTAPNSPEDIKKINCPVYGFYGENDSRVTSTVKFTRAQMKAAGKTYEPVKYDGAGHGFMRSGEQSTSDTPNKKARDKAWKRWISLLKKI